MLNLERLSHQTHSDSHFEFYFSIFQTNDEPEDILLLGNEFSIDTQQLYKNKMKSEPKQKKRGML